MDVQYFNQMMKALQALNKKIKAKPIVLLGWLAAAVAVLLFLLLGEIVMHATFNSTGLLPIPIISNHVKGQIKWTRKNELGVMIHKLK